MNLEPRFDKVLARYDEVRDLLASGEGGDAQTFARLSKEFSELEPVAEAVRAFRKARAEMEDSRALMADPDMRDLAEED